MKSISALLVALVLFTSHARGQEPTPDDLSLIPELPAPVKKSKKAKLAPSKKSSTEQASDDLQERVRYREVKTKALQDPKLQMEWDRARVAKTDYAKRQALKSYYDALFERIVKLDGTLKPRVELARKSVKWRLEQHGIKPSAVAELVDDAPNLRSY